MNLTINGEQRRSEAAHVLALLESLGLDPRAIVVEHNGTVLRREQLESAKLHEGDRLELVRFVGGG